MKISEIYSSGILNKGEEISEHFKANYFINNRSQAGIVIFTNKRFLFLRKASGWVAKGFNVLMSCSWGDVASVSTSGLVSKRLNLNAMNNDKIASYVFSCKNVQMVSQKIIQSKNEFKEKTVIDAQKVIIEEAKKDKADEILKKRLARGEIT